MACRAPVREGVMVRSMATRREEREKEVCAGKRKASTDHQKILPFSNSAIGLTTRFLHSAAFHRFFFFPLLHSR
jgi:hypothetical protein